MGNCDSVLTFQNTDHIAILTLAITVDRLSLKLIKLNKDCGRYFLFSISLNHTTRRYFHVFYIGEKAFPGAEEMRTQKREVRCKRLWISFHRPRNKDFILEGEVNRRLLRPNHSRHDSGGNPDAAA